MRSIAKLPSGERLLLLEFVCSFAWADLTVGERERAFVLDLLKRADLPAADAKKVKAWLESPPKPEEVDPARVPRAHRRLFVEAAREVLEADGVMQPEETAMLQNFADLMR